jgi:hypothetical protein
MRRFPHSLVVAGVLAGGLVEGAAGFLYAAIVAAVVELAVLWFGMLDLRRVRRQRSAPSTSQDALARSFTAVRDELVAGSHTHREFDRALRGRLTRILAVMMQERRGIVVERDPDGSRGSIDASVWSLLDPTRPAASDRDAAGVQLARVRQVVDALETL